MDVRGADQSHINIVRLDLGGRVEKAMTWFVVILLVLLLVIGANGVVMGLNLAKQADMDRSFIARSAELTKQMNDVKTQEWLKERRLMDAEALLLREGIMKPTDIEFGPAGNIHYKRESANGRK